MALIQGKQIADDAITSAKIAPNTILAVDVSTQILVASGANPLTGDLPAGGFKITGLADPTNPQDSATKNYVDATSQGLDVKASMRVATTAALPSNTRTGNVLTATANGALAAQDGVTLVVNDRILVKDEATTANNGLYFVSAVGDGGNPFTLTRTTDADTSAKVTAGLFTFIEEGTTNSDSGWVLTTNNPITLNSTGLVFTQFSGAGAIIAGNGLVRTGNTLDVVIAAGSAGLTANANDIQVNYTLGGGLVAADAAAASAGTAETIPRGDHKHQVSTAAPTSALSIGSVAAAGTASTLLRSDMVLSFPSPAAPADVTKAAASAGASTNAARADHKHDVTTAAPGATSVATASADGAATTLARSDHVHQSNTAPVNVTKAAAAIGTSGEPARADHKHDVTTAAAVDLATANAEGVATTLARSDHTHRTPKGVTANKNLTASVTTTDNDQATATTVSNANALGGYMGVRVNGVHYLVGDGTKVAVDAYFSGDGGTTARAFTAVASGDTLRWNGSVAGFQLAATDRIDIDYDAF